MNETVNEWVRKAAQDFASAERELVPVEMPNFDLVRFLSQQSVEKLLKATLIAAGSIAPKTHDLVRLATLVRVVHPDWSWPTDELEWLTLGAVNVRYPGEDSSQEDAARAADICRRVRPTLVALVTRD